MTTASQTPGSPAELDALFAQARREHRAGRLAEAAAAYHTILAIRPDVAEAHHGLGILLAQQGQFDQAATWFQQALMLRPDHAGAHNSLGNALWKQGKLDEATAHYEQALALRPDYAEAHNNLGSLLAQQGKLDQALARFRQALVLRPDHAGALNNLGSILSSQGKLDEAAARYEQALALWPNYAEAQNNLGAVLWKQLKPSEAAARFEHAIALKPDYAEAHNNLGKVLLDQGRLDQAAARFEQTIALWPDFAEAHFNLGKVLTGQRQFDQAVARFEQALALKPDYVEAHNGLGNVLLRQARLDQAEAHYQQALAFRPDSPEVQSGLAICYLVKADYERGWPAYEARLRVPGAAPLPKVPRWRGEPLAGRSLLLLAEQGLGDTIHFLRYARVLKARGARVVLAAPAALGPLLKSHPDLDEFLPGSAEEFPRCDFCLPLQSAAGALHTEASTIPREVPYLWADRELADRWRQELAKVEGFKIGIVWQGSPGYSGDRWRSLALAQFAPLARLPGVRLVSLQKGFGSEQIATVDFPVLDLSDRLDEAAGAFMDTAAVISNLDLIVAVNTAVAHLTGALGAPLFLALDSSPDWRWLRNREDSPWYPTARLFRQRALGEWQDVIERIAQAVQTRRSETA